MAANIPPPQVARALDVEQYQNAARAAGLQRMAFLAGPYIEIDNPPKKAKKNLASTLRFKLYHHLSGDGWLVTLGEYSKLIDTTGGVLKKHNNSFVAEQSHAMSKEVDAVVMLPSSPGSFLELGAFAIKYEICQKMIIIIHNEYENHINYLNTGPLKMAKTHGASINFIDYSDTEMCWSAVKDFCSDRFERKILNGML
ncbi:MAG: hypothetical protein Q8R81_08625 [Novosphingobium sp.]|uniref:hypothetical protein n=1 Tax=Novosphingobium sp. TaxID=1874826 RepID=UPI002732431B|nr:hypothetical protein [Novosphingobium sp.]MDP3550447.1 hypothetical protein [Novosphingobium sp.]